MKTWIRRLLVLAALAIPATAYAAVKLGAAACDDCPVRCESCPHCPGK